uniref:Uncharacterized protein n=1 Tax=Rhizophora mucronata TaxID=61149 RepID=A0A2P2N2I0_RHIMU
MGTVQYVVGDSSLQVALSQDNNQNGRGARDNACPPADGDVEEKRIRGRGRGESFSVSKIWQWSKSKRLTSSNTRFDTSLLP